MPPAVSESDMIFEATPSESSHTLNSAPPASGAFCFPARAVVPRVRRKGPRAPVNAGPKMRGEMRLRVPSGSGLHPGRRPLMASPRRLITSAARRFGRRPFLDLPLATVRHKRIVNHDGRRCNQIEH